MRLLLLNNLLTPLTKQRFILGDIPFLKSYVAKNHHKNDALLQDFDPNSKSHLHFNVFQFLWVIMMNISKSGPSLPLSFFSTLKQKVEFQDVILRYLTSRTLTYVKIDFPDEDISVVTTDRDGRYYVQEGDKLKEVPPSEILNQTTLLFSIRQLVKEFVLIMIEQDRVDLLKELVLFSSDEVQLVKDGVNDEIKTINGEKIKKGDIPAVIDVILNKKNQEIIYETKSGDVFTINKPIITSTIKKRINSVFGKKVKTEQLLEEYINQLNE